MALSLIILAAGKGTRMKSAKPKVLQTLAGKPLLAHVLQTSQTLQPQNTFIVYGFEGEQVKQDVQNRFTDLTIHWSEQSEQLGTGHAVLMTLSDLPKTGNSLILYGDVPLTQAATLQKLTEKNPTGISILTMTVEDPTGLGRIKRNQDGQITAIVEQKDANPEELAIHEINSGIYCIDNQILHKYIPKIQNNNAQNEYYLTDLIKLAVADGIEIDSIQPQFSFEIAGVNDRTQLADLERTYQSHQVKILQDQGVQFADPMRVDIRGDLKVGKDVFIDTNVIFEGDCTLGDNVYIESGCIITDSQIGNATHLKPYCVITNSKIGAGVDVGPFAHLRPQTELGDRSKIGNFVETKKAKIGTASKVNHLSYIGDANLGENVNIGAGTITCNYNGAQKHLTQIEHNAFIGSNTSLIAPVKIGKGATIGAGSTITKDVNDNALALTRAEQTQKDNWQRPNKRS